jgi:LacI family transcriptional regulator, galactose operon repressor
MATVTIRDVAREAGVSVATVSRALNGISTVDPELVERVRATAEQLGYVPNNVGRALRLKQTNSWAVIVQELNAFITSVVAAAEGAAEREGTSVYLGITGYDEERERRYLQTAISQRVSGLIVGRPSNLGSFSGIGVPIVFVDRGFPDSPYDSVSIDNALAGRLVADHLRDQGFQRIAYISSEEVGTPVSIRSAGLVDTLARAGIDVPPEYRRNTVLTLGGGKQAMLDLLALPNPPEAVFSTNGPVTQGAYLALQAAGNKSVALAGTDDEEWTVLATPPVTVVQQPVTDIGRTAARLLSERVAGSTAPPQDVILTPTLIVRASSRR